MDCCRNLSILRCRNNHHMHSELIDLQHLVCFWDSKQVAFEFFVFEKHLWVLIWCSAFVWCSGLMCSSLDLIIGIGFENKISSDLRFRWLGRRWGKCMFLTTTTPSFDCSSKIHRSWEIEIRYSRWARDEMREAWWCEVEKRLVRRNYPRQRHLFVGSFYLDWPEKQRVQKKKIGWVRVGGYDDGVFFFPFFF